jgi:hypothetical protein
LRRELSIENFDRGHREFSFVDAFDSQQIGSVPTESDRFGSYQLGLTTGRTDHGEGEKESGEEACQEGCEEEEEITISNEIEKRP